jgi:hypothetical protein
MGWESYGRGPQATELRASLENELIGRVAGVNARDAIVDTTLFEHYLRAVVSLHKHERRIWDWAGIKGSPEPARPKRSSAREAAAQRALDAFAPTFLQRISGGEARLRLPLDEALQNAQMEDAREYEQAAEAYREAHVRWTAEVPLADGVLAQDVEAYWAALGHAGVTKEFAAFDIRVGLDSIETHAIALHCLHNDDDIIPPEELKLTATGKKSSKAMAAGKYWAHYQDHVCSCALRLARATFDVLPVSRVIVNVKNTRLDTSTGHLGAVTILGVHFSRDVLDRLNLSALDPSDSLKNFPHRMKFKKTAGFDAVEPMTLDEQWVST